MDFSLFAHMERTRPDQDQRVLRSDLIALAKMACGRYGRASITEWISPSRLTRLSVLWI